MLELAKYGHIDKWKLAFFEIKTKMPCCCVNAHIHPGIEIIFFTGGKHRVVCDDSEYYTEAGDLVIFRSHSIHSIFSLVYDDNSYYVLQLSPSQIIELSGSESHTEHLLELSRTNSGAKAFWSREECEHNGIAKAVYKIADEKEKMNYGYDIAIKMYASRIILAILRESREKQLPERESSELTGLIYKTIIYVNEHYMEDITAEFCSKMCGLSFSYFSRKFKLIARKSFKDYLNFTRINKAEQLLLSTDKTASEIASECGFNSLSHFSVTYKKLKGISPTKTRESKTE